MPLMNPTNFVTPAIFMALKATRYSRGRCTITPTRQIRHLTSITISLHPTLYLPLHREFLPLQTVENWIEEHWSATEAADAEKWMEEAMDYKYSYSESANMSNCPIYCSNVVANKCCASTGSRSRTPYKRRHCKTQCHIALFIPIFFQHTGTNNANNASIWKYATDADFVQ
ncbi:hypothetical protein F5888DRAFT_1636768 [Russula emetica]|nr:hypothetical protein F5888DRAFT_1636768 [Russula emetica]